VSWLLGLQILMFFIYLGCKRLVPTDHLSLTEQVRSSLWLIAFYALTMVISYLGSFGGIGVLTHPYDTLVVTLMALCIYYWGANTGVPGSKLLLEGADE
jgi:hypothetical protein